MCYEHRNPENVQQTKEESVRNLAVDVWNA